jgi:two-component system response regulator HydG
VRELRNVLERALIMSDGAVIARHDLSLRHKMIAPSQQNDVSVFERQLIERALRDTDGNKSKTARRLGLTRTQLYGRLRRYGLQAPVVVAALS